MALGFLAGVQGHLLLQLLRRRGHSIRVATQAMGNRVVGQGGAGVVPIRAVHADALELVHLRFTRIHKIVKHCVYDTPPTHAEIEMT